MQRSMPAAATAVMIALASPLPAQIGDDTEAAYIALHSTPPGALAPVAPNLGRQALSFRAQYGRHTLFDLQSNTFGVGLDFPLGFRHSGGFTLGRYEPDGDVDGHFMFGGQLAGNIYGVWTEPGMGTSVSLAYEAQLGYAQSDGIDMISFFAGFPVAFPIRYETVSLVPFVTPAAGWGRMSFAGDHASDIRFILGGGGSLELASGLGFHIGLRRVFVDDADIMWGLGVTWRPR